MSSQKPVTQEFGTVEENAVRLDQDKAEQLVDALNTDLAATEVLYHQLRKHHWTVNGAQYRDLHLFYEEAYEDASEAADHLGERVQALGGVPINRPADFQDRSPVEPEQEDILEVRTMMKNDEEMYGDIIERVREHVELAENLGDYATSELLREQLEELEEYAHEIEHFLAEDSLTKW
ncbi:DNA starvation/stationary phase protection protein DpsA [Natronoarchaeum mannanilyticum]|uniref:DNA starvation/stationary phase protection protein DpsA n=1 Tax=Natronoarchaeum mannanilyticum TaxID=926360 RepID=A0AAV3T7S9_9EURY